MLGALTYSLFRKSLGKFYAYRFFAPLLFAILLALIHLRAASAWGRPAALAATLCALFMPRLFADNHIGATEAPLCFFWFLAAVSFQLAMRRKRFAPLAGVAFGLAMSVKFTAFLLPAPLILWGLVYHRRKLWLPALCLLLVGPLVFILLQPSMWDHPVKDVMEFVLTSAGRKQWNPIWVYFLGRIYGFAAPFYCAPFMVLVTAPLVSLALFFIAVLKMILEKFRDDSAGAALIHFCFLIARTMAPNAPTIGGVRLFLPAFVFLALLAGRGAASLSAWLIEKIKNPRLAAAASFALFALCMALMAFQFGKNYPYGLEYYNELIGGVRGGRETGLQTTYWWTVLNEDALERVNRELPPKAVIRFFPMADDLWRLYQELGWLRPDIKVTDYYDFDYILILSRPYWNAPEIFRFLKIPQRELQVKDYQSLDRVPLWILYQPQSKVPPKP